MRAIVAAGILVWLCGPASAQGFREGQWELSLEPGWAVPVGPVGDRMGSAWTLALDAGYQVNDFATVGLQWGIQAGRRVFGVTTGDYAADYDGDGVADKVPFSSNVREALMNLTPYLKAGPWLDAGGYKWRPFGVIGGGWYREWLGAGTLVIAGQDETSGRQVGPLSVGRDNSVNSFFGVNAGGGFDFQIDDNAALGVDVRYIRVFHPVFDLEFVNPTFRIIYLF